MREPLPRFKAPKTAPAGRFRRVPPAIFPPLLGVMGLALSWRGGVRDFALPPALAEFMAGCALALFACAVFTYAAKLARRPGVLAGDLAILPGRAGVGAGVLCLYLAVGLLHPFAPFIGRGALIVALGLHLVMLAVLLRVMLSAPPEQRRITPVWHLNFVGFIVAARVALLLDLDALARVLFWPALVAAVLIWGAGLRQALRERVPAPLRPLLAIHLAPVALLGTVAAGLGMPVVGWGAGVVALVAVLVMLAAARWLLASGFTPMWGAMTFPLAATAGLWSVLAAGSGAEWARLVAGMLLVAATLFIIPVFARLWKMWMQGGLAVKTNAAIA